MEALKDRLERYERELSGGGNPRVEDYVVDVGTGYWEELLEFLEVDIDLRIRRGELVGVRDYFARFPGLEEHGSKVFRLLELEVAWRRELGLPLSWSEYRERYPQWRLMLEEKFWSMDLMVPEVPGYDLRPVIAKGGMGVVFSAWDQKLGREVAIKVMRPGMPEAAFNREVDITARLQHPGIPPVHDRGKLSEGLPYLVMKLIRGETLEAILERRKRESGLVSGRGELLGVFERICQAVGYAHKQGVIHRDLKPLNVMVGAFGEVQVMDWGLSRELQTGEEGTGEEMLAEVFRGTLVRGVKGTLEYMAPEQARDEELDPRADVFALGGILLSILTGRPPFEGSSREEAIGRAKRNDQGDAIERLEQSGAEAELQTLCKRCLSSVRQDRPADGTALAEAVATYRSAVEERVKRVEMARVREEEQRRRRRAQWALAGTGLMLAVTGVFGVVVASLWQTSEANRKEAISQRDAAETSRQLVETEREKLKTFKICSTIRSASDEWRKGNFPRVRELLASIELQSRNWEWHYLNRLLNPSIMKYQHGSGVNFIAAGYGDTVISCSDNLLKIWELKNGEELYSFRTPLDGISRYDTKGEQLGPPIVAISLDGALAMTDLSTSPPILGEKWTSEAKVWETKTGKLLFNFKEHKAPVHSASFSKNKKRIVTASLDGTAIVWDAMTGRKQTVLKSAESGLGSVEFNPDGSQVLSVCSRRIDGMGNRLPGEVVIWDANTGDKVFTIKGQADGITSAKYSQDGSMIVTGSWDGKAKLWSAKTGECVRTIDGQKGGVWSFGFSPDGLRVVTNSSPEMSNPGEINIWDTKKGNSILKLKKEVVGESLVVFSSNGKKIITNGGKEGDVNVFDASMQPEKLVFKVHSEKVVNASFNREGNEILTRSINGNVKVINAMTGNVIYQIANIKNEQIIYLDYDTDGKKIVAVNRDGRVRAWDSSKESEPPFEMIQKEGVEAFAWSPNGKRIATASVDGKVKVCDIIDSRAVQIHETKPEFWQPSGVILEELPDGTIKETRQEPILNLVEHLNFSADGTQLIGTRRDGTVKVWNAATGSELFIFEKPSLEFAKASFDQDGKRVVAGSIGGNVYIFDAKTGLCLVTFTARVSNGFDKTNVSFSPDGKRVIVPCGYENALQLWDATIGEEILTLDCQTVVTSASFSSDGKRIVTTHEDGSVTVWDSHSVAESVAERDFAETKRKVK